MFKLFLDIYALALQDFRHVVHLWHLKVFQMFLFRGLALRIHLAFFIQDSVESQVYQVKHFLAFFLPKFPIRKNVPLLLHSFINSLFNFHLFRCCFLRRKSRSHKLWFCLPSFGLPNVLNRMRWREYFLLPANLLLNFKFSPSVRTNRKKFKFL